MKRKVYIILHIMAFCTHIANADMRIGNVFIERYDVFEKADRDWFFGAPLLNALHTKTQSYVIEDELLFRRDDIIDEDYLLETERNLRATGLFTKVKIEIDSVKDNTYDIFVVTKDRWSLYPSILFGTGGGATNYGGRLQEFNLFGTGTYIGGDILHRGESEIGWQGLFQLSQRRLFRSSISLNFSLLANQYRTGQNLELAKHYLALDDRFSYGIASVNQFGKDFLFYNDGGLQLAQLDETIITSWFSRAWWRDDRVFFTAMTEYHRADRGEDKYNRAFDNSGKILFAFSSVSQDYYAVDYVNSYFLEDLTIGGWGSAILGKVFPIGSKGESYYYVAGQGERSYYKNNIYLFGQLTGASAFARGTSYYTYQEFLGKGFYKFDKTALLAVNFRQQTVWNWWRIRQLILDNDIGLRGYELNSISGDNRIIGNVEFRYFPNIKLWLFNLSGVIFYDIGSAWFQDTKLSKARFYSSAGSGIRIHFNKSDNPKHILRVDFAYNFAQQKFGGILIGTEQAFSAFKNHVFSLPKIFGLEFDYD